MKTIFFKPNLTPDERVEELNKICYNKGDDTFQRSLTESEIAVEKDVFIKLTVDEQRLKDEAKTSAQDYAKRINVIVEEKNEALERINTRQREVYDKLYWVVDAANGNMNFFDRYGELIKSRKLTPDETNGVLFNNDGQPNEAKEIEYIPIEPEYTSDVQDADFEEVQDIEGVADGSTDEDDDLPEFLKPDGNQEQETQQEPETGKKKRNTRKGKQTPEKE